jgi:hypothetical protein
MYYINILNLLDDSVEIQIFNDDLLIGNKIFELNFNENKKPTFVESGCEYDEKEFDKFILNVENFQTPDEYSFDDQDRFDGFEFIKQNEKYYLVLKIVNELSNLSLYMLVTEETKESTIQDLRIIYKTLNEMIKKQLENIDRLENPDAYIEEI